MNYTLKQLESAGGKLWEKNTMRRVYFNSLADRIGLNVNYYNTGNVSSASLNGESISNTSARKILFSLEYGKIWYDLNDNSFHTKNLGDYEDEIIESVKKDVENVVDAENTPTKLNDSDDEIDDFKKKTFGDDVIEYASGMGSLGMCYAECGGRLNDFLVGAAMYTNQSIADVIRALKNGKRVMFDYANDIGEYCLRNISYEQRIAEQNKILISEQNREYAKTHKRYTCKSCKTSGYRGSYPFTTAPDAGYCDDCL